MWVSSGAGNAPNVYVPPCRLFQPVSADDVERQGVRGTTPGGGTVNRSDLLVGVGESGDGVPAEFRICDLLHVASAASVASVASVEPVKCRSSE